ncbi:MAG: YggS family pyridoxal phosphate-dependent enzyme [Ruminococcaceae bacterium]|nr:YggS family pyridoxal phosphate-dependent enzyme [Oscillospiraceae bacterium]
MTEKSSIDIFSENYRIIEEDICKSAQSVGLSRDDIILLAATKTVPYETINFAIESGIKYIGENRVQEFLSKDNLITKDVHRHFIGHLQSNKVKDIVGKVEMIQSVHSVKLASLIGKLSCEKGITTDILLEVNIGAEENKSGFLKHEIDSAVEEISKIDGICVKGMMTIPPVCEKKTEIIPFFEEMYKLFIDNKCKKIDNVSMEYLSMGMSSDYSEAIKCGSNLVRIGTSLFGKRIY